MLWGIQDMLDLMLIEPGCHNSTSKGAELAALELNHASAGWLGFLSSMPMLRCRIMAHPRRHAHKPVRTDVSCTQ